MVGLMVREGRFTIGIADDWEPREGCLSIIEREELLVGLRVGESLSSIARRLGRSASTISREVAATGGRETYSAWTAHQRARGEARRPKPGKLRAGPLRDEITRRLLELWSPDEIAQRLPLEFPDDPEMRVSHETIYQSLFVQGRGELRRELARCLRSGRTSRKKRGTVDRRGRIPGMVNISERPAEAADRAVPGHWEGDLILGEGGRIAVGTLVERTTRLVLLLHLEGGRSAVTVEAAMRKAIATLPIELRRSITWDRAPRCRGTRPSRRRQEYRSTSAIRTLLGSGGRTRTPTGFSVSTCRRAPTSRSSPPPTSSASSAALTTVPAKPSAT